MESVFTTQEEVCFYEGFFSLSLFPVLQKHSFIDATIALLPLTVRPSTVKLGTAIVFDLLLITWSMVFKVFFYVSLILILFFPRDTHVQVVYSKNILDYEFVCRLPSTVLSCIFQLESLTYLSL